MQSRPTNAKTVAKTIAGLPPPVVQASHPRPSRFRERSRRDAIMTRLMLDNLPEELLQLAARRSLGADQILFQQRDRAESIFFLESGQIRLVNFTDQQIINNFFVEPGESFAESAPFSDTYACTAIADLPSEVIAIPKPVFLEALHQDFDFCRTFMAQLVYRFDNVRSLLVLRSIRSARERLLRYLMMKRGANQTIVDLDRPLKDIASELGLVPEVLSRALAMLQNEGIINRDKRRIHFDETWLNSVGHSL